MMAGPLGYPDYQRLDNVDSPTLVSEAQVGRVAVQTGGDLDVSRYSHLRMRIIPDQKGSYLFVKFLWKRVRNGGEIEGEREIAISPLGAGPEGELMFSVPNLGPFVKWQVGEMTKGLKEWLSEWRIAADNRPVGLECPVAAPVLVPYVEHVVKAGETVTVLPRYYFAGPISVSADTTNNVSTAVAVEVRDPVINEWKRAQVVETPKETQWKTFSLQVPLGAWRMTLHHLSAETQTVVCSAQPCITGSS